ncbi:MAG: hypothetical protein ABIO24_11770, partial [Saprospiraceae bacterium]
MKTISYKALLISAIALIILLGANSAEIPNPIRFFRPEPPLKTPTFESAHGESAIPIPDEADMDCKGGTEH